MASSFFIITHYVKPEKAGPWWNAVSAILTNPEKLKEAENARKNAGFYNHTFMPTSRNGPFYCVWEAQEGKTISDLQNYVDSKHDINQEDALMNVISKIDTELTGEQTPYPRFFN